MYVPSTGGENSRCTDIQGVPKTDEKVEASIIGNRGGSRAQIKSNNAASKPDRQAGREAGRQAVCICACQHTFTPKA
jgi:hypothetical protein